MNAPNFGHLRPFFVILSKYLYFLSPQFKLIFPIILYQKSLFFTLFGCAFHFISSAQTYRTDMFYSLLESYCLQLEHIKILKIDQKKVLTPPSPLKLTNFRETYFREGKKRQPFTSFIFAFLVFFTLFLVFLMHIFTFLRGLVCSCEFYFPEKGEIREIRENSPCENQST